MKKAFLSLFAAGLFLASLSPSRAVNTTFAQFYQLHSEKPFTFTSGGVGNPGTLTATNISVRFKVLSALNGFRTGVKTVSGAVYTATLTITAHTSALGSFNTQDSALTDLDMTFRKVGASDGLANGAILLRVTTLGGNLFAPADVSIGTLMASSVGNADPPDFVQYTSSMWKLSTQSKQQFVLAFTGAENDFSYAGVFPFFLDSNQFDAVGSFSMNK